MRTPARLAISAIALTAGMAVFWVSISSWTYDRIYTHDALAKSCPRDRDAARFVDDPRRFRAYLAHIVALDAGAIKHPPSPAGRFGEMLIERFGFLYVPQRDYVHFIETMPACGQPSLSPATG